MKEKLMDLLFNRILKPTTAICLIQLGAMLFIKNKALQDSILALASGWLIYSKG